LGRGIVDQMCGNLGVAARHAYVERGELLACFQQQRSDLHGQLCVLGEAGQCGAQR
jgi:hypothetical protein